MQLDRAAQTELNALRAVLPLSIASRHQRLHRPVQSKRYRDMMSLAYLMEESLQIAWDYLERSGEIGDGAVASRHLGDTIELMIRRGQRSRLLLSNRAITAYLRFKNSSAEASTPEQLSR
jgi:hypothetical protein